MFDDICNTFVPVLKDGSHLCHGEEFAGAVSQLWAMDVGNLVAVGVNCTHRDFITPLLKSLDEAHLSHVPVIIYPNGGEDYSQPGYLLHFHAIPFI